MFSWQFTAVEDGFDLGQGGVGVDDVANLVLWTIMRRLLDLQFKVFYWQLNYDIEWQ